MAKQHERDCLGIVVNVNNIYPHMSIADVVQDGDNIVHTIIRHKQEVITLVLN